MPRKHISRGFVRNIRRKNKGKKSDLEKIVEGWLKERGYEFKAQHPIGRCHVDVFLPPKHPWEKGTVVEINGCYWHSHSCLKKPRSSSQIKRRQKDAKRYKFLLNQGYDLKIIWGCEISNNWKKVARILREAAGPKNGKGISPPEE